MSRFRNFDGKLVGRAGLLFLACSALVALIHFLPDFDEIALGEYVRGKGPAGVAVYILVTAVGSAVGVPRQGFSFVGGAVFGAVPGLIYATAGTTLGCAASFYLIRRFGRPYVTERFSRRLQKFDNVVSASPFSMTLVVRCFPVGNNALTNALAGVSSIPARWFIAGSLLGYIPQNFIFSLLGSGMRVDPFWRTLAAAALFAVSLGIGIALFRRHKTSFAPEGTGEGGAT